MLSESTENLLDRNRELQSALEEAEETLRAIRNGEVDAIVATGPDGDAVYTLKGADESYRIFVEQMSEGAVTLSPDGLILFANQQFADIVGLPLERVMGLHLEDLIPAEDRSLAAAVLSARDGGKSELNLKRDGKPVPVYFSSGSLRSGGLDCVTLVVTDLTEQKRNETIVADGQLARSILQQAAAAMLVLSPDGKIIQASQAAETLAGAPILLQPFGSVFQLRSGADAQELPFQEILSRVERNGSVTGLQALIKASGGENVPVIVNAGLLTDSNSETLGYVIIFSDISELRKVEEALRASEARERTRAGELNAILEAAPVAMAVSQDPECRQIIGNRAAYEMFRLPPGGNISKSAPEGERPMNYQAVAGGREIPPNELPLQRAAFSGMPVRDYEFDLLFVDGTRRNLLGQAMPLMGDDGRPHGAVGAFMDVTEHKRTQERFQQTQKLESIGLLAGGIAHDFNNLLTGVLGNASLLLDEVAGSAAEQVKEIINGAERAAALTRQLLAYSGKGQFVIQQLDVSEAVHEISGLVQFSIPSNAQLAVTAEGRLPPVRMDPGQLQQILMNLIINAGEAIGERAPGRISVATSTVDVGEGFTDALGEDIPPGRYVSIEVADTGCGIDEGSRSKVFEPFFTTKFTGRGLGLAAAAGIIRSQKGAITLESVVGQGSVFRVFLPVADRHDWEPQARPDQDGRRAVLVVDDETVVCNFIAEVLRRRGYRVLLASNGREALAICERESGAIDAAVVDVLMPLMGASDLLPALKSQHPQIKILLTSGCSESEARRLSGVDSSAHFIQKPYAAKQIARAVDELLKETYR